MDSVNYIPNVREYLDDVILTKLFGQYIQDIDEAKGSPSSGFGAPDEARIIKAIQDRFYVGIYYKEEGDEVLDGFRLIEPYVYGKGFMANAKLSYPNREYLRAFVVKSSDPVVQNKKNFPKRKSVSKSKKIPYWRLFRINRISSWQLIPRKITQYRELYNPNDLMINDIIISADINAFSQGKANLKLPRDLRNKVGKP